MNFSKNDQRKVLLIDGNLEKQQLRAVAMRNCEIEVHTAGNIADAVRRSEAFSYDLVLLAAQENSEQAAALCSQLRKSRPKQRIVLLVGAPHYVREVGREEVEMQPVAAPPTARMRMPATPLSQWHVMLQRLLAAG